MAVRWPARRGEITAGGGASSLTDLSDVNTAGVTNRNVLVADGVDFESRALVEADISDLGAYITGITESDIETALAASASFVVNNYAFNADQTVGVGQDNYVLTYDNATGEIGLEAAAGASITQAAVETAFAAADPTTFNNYVFNTAQTIGPSQDNYVLTYDNTGGQISLEVSQESFTELSQDTTPVLGGGLGLGGFDITGIGNINIAGTIESEATGTDHATHKAYHTTQGGWALEANDTDGDTTLFQTDSAGNLEDAILHADRNAAVALFWNGSQKFFTDQGGCGTNSGFFFVGASSYAYTPGAGTGVLWLDSITDTLYFRNDSGTDFDVSSGGGLSNLVEDTTPQLGGQLSTNGFDINFDTAGDHALFADDNACIWGTGFDAAIAWNGTVFRTNFALTNQTWQWEKGVHFKLFDSTDTDYLDIHHDGTDVNFTHATTTDWNISGITAINAGAVDLDVDALTATSYGGITEANLLDKSAAETITGAWVASTSLNAVPLSRSISATTTTATTDYGIIIALTGGSAQELTLDSDPPTNAVVMVDNRSGNAWTIATATASNLIWAKDATTGDRTLADDGVAVCLHRGSGVWIINGSDLLT